MTVSLRKLGQGESSPGKSGIERLPGVELEQWRLAPLPNAATVRLPKKRRIQPPEDHRAECQMSSSLFRDTVKFLSGLEPIQLELEQLYERRLVALSSVDPAVLLRLVEEEQAIQQRLRRQLQQRSVILGRARRERLASTNLRKLLHDLSRFVEPEGEIDSTQYQQTTDWMKRIEQRSWTLRQTSWVNWHAVRRGVREFTEIRNLIANCGERPADQKGGPGSVVSGGALIDTAV